MFGCAGPTVTSKEFVNQENFINLQIPLIFVDMKSLKCISDEYKHRTNGSTYNVGGVKCNFSSSKLTLETYKGAYMRRATKLKKSAISYSYNVLLNEKEGNSIISLHIIPQEKNIISATDVIGKPFELSNISLNKSNNYIKNNLFIKYLGYDFEINSNYSSDSIYANFKRIVPYKKNIKDKISNKIYKTLFTLTYDNLGYKFIVDVYPYRNGSKAVIKIVPRYIKVKNIMRYVTGLDKVKKEIEKIINS